MNESGAKAKLEAESRLLPRVSSLNRGDMAKQSFDVEVEPQTSGALKRKLFKWRRYLILILTPLVLLPLPLTLPSTESRCAYCILIMAVYWVTEVVSLAVTALLPLVLFPMLGVVGSKQISPPYFQDTNVLFMGGLIVAVAIEHWMLHKRIALRVLLLVGSQPRRLMLGFMLVTAFLSMWISNTATTAMMVPIAEAVLSELKKEEIKQKLESESNSDTVNQNEGFSDGPVNNGEEDTKNDDIGVTLELGIVKQAEEIVTAEDKNQIEKSQSVDLLDDETQTEIDRRFMRMSKMLLLSIAYAANIGGTATLTGTAPNLVLSGQVIKLYPKSPGIGFADWFFFAFPEMLILLFVAWCWLQVLFLGIRCGCCKKSHRSDKEQDKAVRVVLLNQYKALGPMSFAEIAVLVHFIMLALLWLFRDPKFMKGWSVIFPEGYVKDGTVAMVVAFSLFVFPSKKPEILCWNPEGKVTKPPEALLTWKTVAHKLPWNIIILLGSGFALAEACKVSGLSEWLGLQLVGLNTIPSYGIVAIVCILITTFTEVTSNTATATIFLPILASLGENINVHPWYLMIPATVSCSFAFMLPVATPPNAIVFAGGELRVSDMAKAGIGMNILGVAILLLCVHTYGMTMFGLDTFPSWVEPRAGTNTTLVCKNVTI
ncbi:solute carrier family 13 member 2 [Nematostella vectensis]|uniref:solute carrier family 13 member 2 n=1 Tax=Nematostella vectensis TaxID=45351 RepID=UPI002076D7DA|nr:solute carrier family 13 member 2 [Nematostella vectensis]